MGENGIIFDHVHLISEDPQSAASWYADNLGGRIVGSSETKGSVQVLVSFKGASLIIRGRRQGEAPEGRQGTAWGIDHFGFQVSGDFDGYCDGLKKKGIKFTLDPVDFTPTVRIAFIEAPDGVSIELLQRRG